MAEADTPTASLDDGTWRLSPEHSSLEFSVPHFYGLMHVKGHFDRYAGELNLERDPAVSLTVEATSVNTGNRKRDEHLRSKDFFTVAEHPELRFHSSAVQLRGNTLQVSGTLEALGHSQPLELPLRVIPDADGFDIEGSVQLDQREIGISWSPLGITRTPTTLSLRGRLVR
jgi:polyisoprenoid-binding protein YceI